MTNKRNQIIFSVVLVAGTLVVGLRMNFIKLPLRITSGAATYIENLNDNRELLGAAHNVFVGKVLEQSGSQARGYIGPETQFRVEIVRNIKGNLNSSITVDQEAGYRNGVLFVADRAIDLLQPGNTYLLATRYSQKYDWYTMISYPNAIKLISSNALLSTAELQRIVATDDKVKAFESAYSNEIVTKSDIAASRAWNSYASRHYDASGQLVDDTVELAKQRANGAPAPVPSASAAPAATHELTASPEPASSPTITPSAESPVPSPTEVPVQS